MIVFYTPDLGNAGLIPGRRTLGGGGPTSGRAEAHLQSIRRNTSAHMDAQAGIRSVPPVVKKKRETFAMIRHKPTRFTTFSPVFLLLLVACSEIPRWTGSVEVRDGIKIVSNPGDPLLTETQGLVSELWSAQGSNWMDPSRVHGRSEFLTVVDPPANQVHVVSASGEMQTSLGRPGGGPGEFLRLLDAFREGDRIVVLDGGKESVEYLDLDGNYLSSLHIDGQAWGGFPLDGGELLLKGEFLSDPSEETLGDWVKVREGSGPRAFSIQPLEPLPAEQGVQCSDLSAWGGGAARLRFTTPQVQVFDPAGGLLMESWIDLSPEVVSDSERESALSDLERELAARGVPPAFMEQNLIVMEERWRVKCRFGPLRFDPSGQFGAFLEQNPDEFGAGPATLHFLSKDGVYLAEVAFPTPWRDFALDAGVVYALTRDPTSDLITLKAFQVDFPDSLFSEASRILDRARRREPGDG